MTQPQPYGLGGILAGLTKRKVFLSYHHRNDQWYYDTLSKTYAGTYDIFSDTSLDRTIDSDNTAYVRWKIAQDHIKGSSCTIVLLGAETAKRKYVDWEIHYTLEMGHGLLGVSLPTCPRAQNGACIVPDRFHQDFQSGHAVLTSWNELNAMTLKAAIETSVTRERRLITNTAPLRQRNG